MSFLEHQKVPELADQREVEVLAARIESLEGKVKRNEAEVDELQKTTTKKDATQKLENRLTADETELNILEAKVKADHSREQEHSNFCILQ